MKSATRTSFAASAYIFVVVVLGTTIPTPLYPLYQQEFGFDATQTTVLFATYAIGVLASLVLFGRLSDALGRKPMLFAGIVLSLLSSVAFLISASLGFLYVGRVLSGVAAGIFIATGTVSVMENAPSGSRRIASAVATAANIGGAGLGLLMSGFVAQYLGSPLLTPFLIHSLLTLIAGIALIRVREGVVGRLKNIRLQLPPIPHESRRLFWAAAPGATTGYAVLGLFSAVTPNFMRDNLSISSTAVTGLVVFLFYGLSGGAQIGLRKYADRTLILVGSVMLMLGMLFLGSAVLLGSLPLLIASSALSGIAQGLLFMTGIRAIAAATTFENQTGATTAYFVLAYVSLSIPTIGIGVVASRYGLAVSTLFFATIAFIGCSLGFLGIRRFSRADQGD